MLHWTCGDTSVLPKPRSNYTAGVGSYTASEFLTFWRQNFVPLQPESVYRSFAVTPRLNVFSFYTTANLSHTGDSLRKCLNEHHSSNIYSSLRKKRYTGKNKDVYLQFLVAAAGLKETEV